MAPARHNLTRRALLGAGAVLPLFCRDSRLPTVPSFAAFPTGDSRQATVPSRTPSFAAFAAGDSRQATVPSRAGTWSCTCPHLPDCPAAEASADASRGQSLVTVPTPSWSRALAAYSQAEAKLAAFRRHVESLPSAARAFPECEPLDDRFDDLECARLAALRRLLALPAPDLPALALKISRIVGDQAWELSNAEPALAALKADARRLCGQADGAGP